MAALVLTLVLAVGWALCIALGYWHGGWRQVVMLAGILLSSAVLSEWAGPNGRDLSNAFGWSVTRAATGAALAYLIGGGVILGGLGSMLLPRRYPIALRERLLGALVGVLNGGLALALTLRIMRAYAFAPGTGKALHDSPLSRFLIEEVGYLLIAAFAIGIIAVIVGFAVSLQRTTADNVPRDEDHPEAVPMGPQLAPATAPIAAAPGSAHRAVAIDPRFGPTEDVDPYAAAPLIDWPTDSPPGMPVSAAPVPSAHIVQPAPVPAPARIVIPTNPRLPARVSPPIWYPVEGLMSGHINERPSVPPAPPARQTTPPVAAAATPVMPPASPLIPVAPRMPPPGAPFPATPLPPPEPPAPLSEEPVVVRELDPATRDSGTVPAPHGIIAEAETMDPAPQTEPPEAESESEDAMRTVGEETEAKTSPAVKATATATAEEPPADVMRPVAELELEAESPPREEAPASATAAFAPVTPSPLPPVAPSIAANPEPSRPRASYARVAQTRQPSDQPPTGQPPRPSNEEGPAHPPLPTGPDIRRCPACGYPVRPHTRYCPNCGNRLSR